MKRRTKPRTKPRTKTTRQTGRKSRLLENAVHAVKLRGFHIFDNIDEFERGQQQERSVVYNFPHATLWGTKGRKEAVILCPNTTAFAPDEDGHTRIVIEAKYQDGTGSVDEKLPYIWISFLGSPIHNWIIILDGRFWRDKRGKKAADWLRQQQKDVPAERTFTVLTPREFIDLVERTWQ